VAGENEYICREADESDFEGIADLLHRHDYASKDPAWSKQKYIDWLTWKFRDNPDGPARIFIVEDSHSTIVGIRVHLPRRFRSAETGTFLAYLAFDALTDVNLRRRGLYKKLREFAVASLESPDFSFPTPFNVPVSIRFGYRDVGPTRRWSFPVAAGMGVSEKPYGLFTSLADMSLKLYTFIWLGRLPADLQMKSVIRFDKEFDIDPTFIHGVRSAEYLNWRFIDNLVYDYSAFEFFEGDTSIGYCVYAVRRGKAEINDFVVDRRDRECLRLLIEHCRGRGITRLRFRGVGLNMGRFGFLRRSDPANPFMAKGVPKGSWMLTLSDRDY
jgi:hypothetical protein